MVCNLKHHVLQVVLALERACGFWSQVLVSMCTRGGAFATSGCFPVSWKPQPSKGYEHCRVREKSGISRRCCSQVPMADGIFSHKNQCMLQPRWANVTSVVFPCPVSAEKRSKRCKGMYRTCPSSPVPCPPLHGALKPNPQRSENCWKDMSWNSLSPVPCPLLSS